MKKNLLVFALLLSSLLCIPQMLAEEITPAGKHLAESLDALHVEELWQVGHKVDWRTGESISVYDKNSTGSHTHCSAFAAAAADSLGIYLLHPPEHSQNLLANAQQDWLRGSGTNHGWRPVESPLMAQHLANQGQFVVVTCKNPDPKLPGHIAIVRPSTKSEAEILAEGPQITQAGGHNYSSGTVKQGFKNHPGAFEKKQLLYFVHPLPLAHLEGQ